MQKEDGEDEVSPHISGLYTITQKPTTILTGGQALITFEKKEVASRILKLPKCSVSCEQKVFEVRPKRLTLGSSVKFAVQLDVSKKELLFSGVRSAMPPERIRDRLESKRSVLLDNITDVDEEDEMSDMLEIFFQKPTNSGWPYLTFSK
ncbi:hypothetical protein NHX12_006682 [Muraenolepis orangiensis]|uniref:NID domain-containing protein n=1 Tax=Muraenolepis orangiensis TaxID=630683 RepID=A0A9Q0IAE2_9TELE|nr:hypothetical protein NHX12_006682 [Muraenolepis orangiensis]